MIRKESINFVAQILPPNPKEVSYWIDLGEDPTGATIKTYAGKSEGWIKVNRDINESQDDSLATLRKDLNQEVSDRESADQDLQEQVEAKSTVSFTQSLTSGTLIGTLTIDGTQYSVYSTNNTTYSAATSSTRGLVLQGDAVSYTDTDSPTADTVATTLNELITSLRNAGIIAE